MTDPENISSLQKAAVALREMRAQLDALKSGASEPIAIVGLACRFPGSGSGIDGFWNDLRSGRDCISEVPPERWSLDRHYDPDPTAPGKMYTRHGGFVPDIDKFDASFFGIHPHEAERMDPQQRLVLETAWASLEHAGIAPDRLTGTKTGVYFGLMTVDYLRLLMGNGKLSAIDPFAALSNGLSFSAGRLSYTLGLQGPSMVIATACSSSLVAMHLACQGLRNHECDLAIAGGVNAILSPEMHVLLSKTQVLSPSGRSKAFDVSADGYVRGEGCGAVVLMRLSDAQRRRHRLWAICRGSATNHCGMSGALTVPSGVAQHALIQEALRNSRVAPDQVGYVEAHGTGTPLGDPIELRALDQVMRQGHSHRNPCYIGSVKSNIGHLEAGAGVASIIKTVLSLDHEEIPPSLHFRNPTPHVPWNDFSLRVVDNVLPWPRGKRPRIAGVSSFGLSGINAHVVLEEAPLYEPALADASIPHILTLSAKTESALRTFAGNLVNFFDHDPAASIADVCYTLNVGRATLPFRLATVVSSLEAARRNLAGFLDQSGNSAVFTGRSMASAKSVVITGRDEASLREICKQWVSGSAIDWRQFYSDTEYWRIPLPGYPFERTRYWAIQKDIFDPQVQSDASDSRQLKAKVAGYLYHLAWADCGPAALLPSSPAIPSPTTLHDAADEIIPRLSQRMAPELALYRDLAPHLKELATVSALTILRRMGWSIEAGDSMTLDELCLSTRCLPNFAPYLNRLIEIASEAGYVRRVDERFYVDSTPPQRSITEMARQLSDRFPGGLVELQLLARCAEGAAAVLHGEQDALELLFARDETNTLENFYTHSGAYRALNELIGEVTRQILASIGDGRRIRVLEAGAGTGATTSVVIPLMPQDRVEYVFTDVSPAFTTAAAHRFSEFPGLQAAVFDLEYDGSTQGFSPSSYDIVLAVNVLHATSDVRRSTSHLLELLAPGGLLLIVEGISPQGWLDIMFGLLPGWWSFGDRELRPTHPLLAEHKWLELLKGLGCVDVRAVPDSDQARSFGVEIQQSIIVARAPDASPQDKYWLLFGDGRIDSELAVDLEQSGDRVIRVRPGDGFEETESGSFIVDPAQRDDFRAVLDRTLCRNPRACAGIVYMWAMETPPAGAVATDESWQHRICGGLLQLVSALSDLSLDSPPRLTVATAGAVPVEASSEQMSPHHATVWGLGRVIASERPELRCRLIDLEGSSTSEDARSLFDEIKLDNAPNVPHPLIAIRGARRRSAVIDRFPDPTPDSALKPISEEGVYAIVGGSGGLGMLSAEWLIGKGARQLALISRRPPSPESKARLEREGVTVTWLETDVCDLAQMRSCFETIQSSGHRLKGVIHSAGVLQTGPLASEDWSRFWSVLAPKVNGTAVICALTRDLPLDFLIFFSSAVTLISEPGTAAYCAANTFLDSQAAAMRLDGSPALSIAWGEWSSVGMAKVVRSRREQRRAAIQAPALSVDEGLCALELLVSAPTPLCAVVPVDLSLVSRSPSVPANIRPLLSRLAALSATAQQPLEDLPSRLLKLSPQEREAAVTSHLVGTIAVTLGVSESEVSSQAKFTDLNLDSLAVMEILNSLRQSLGIMIYPREVFGQGAVDRLASYIVSVFERSHGLRPNAGAPLSSALLTEFESKPAAPMLHRNPPAIFILSAPRSGSTLLRIMLAGHSRLFAPPELHLLPFATMAERSRKLDKTYFGEGLQRALMDLRAASPENTKKSLEEMEAADEPIQNVYSMLQNEASPRVLVDKTPAYATNMDALLRAEAMFDQARYLCLVRHPLAVIESFVRMRFSHLIGAGDVDPYDLAEEVWYRSYSNLRDLCARVGQERSLLVRYEDLVRTPEEELLRICDFLHIPYEESIVRPYDGARMTDGVHAGSAPLNDPNFLQHSKIEGDLADRWRSVDLPRPLAERTRRLAAEFGYELPPASETLREDIPSWKERFVELRSGRHALCCWGEDDKPLVVLIHGLLEHGGAWELVGARLDRLGLHALAPDLRGHGRSIHTPPGVLYHPLDFLGDLDDLLAHETGSPVHLVGHSMGAALAALYASARPQRVSSLVLVEPPGTIAVRTEDPGDRIAVQLDYLAASPRQQLFSSVEEAARRLQQGFSSLSQELAEAMAARITEPATGEGVQWSWDARLSARAGIGFGGFAGASPADLLRSLEKMRGPVTLVYGDSSNLIRPEEVEAQTSSLPSARKVTLPGGHNLHYETPDLLAEIIADTARSTSPMYAYGVASVQEAR
ncbi:MAG: alpha/beta fold hydrolase [Terracidiphilus sp.]